MAVRNRAGIGQLRDAAVRHFPLLAGLLLGIGLAAGLFAARAVTVNSDMVQSALAADDILSGNVLLKHWVLTADNFLFTDTLFYVLLRPVLPGMVLRLTVIPGLLYWGVAALAMALAYRSAPSRPKGVLAALLTGLLLAAPDLAGAGSVMLVSDQHVGSLLWALAALLAAQRLDGPSPSRGMTALFVAASIFLLASDPFGLFFLSAPLAVYLLLRLASGVAVRPAARLLGWHVAATLAGIFLPGLIRLMGGFHTLRPFTLAFVDPQHLLTNLAGALFGLLHLFGAYLFSRPLDSFGTLLMLSQFLVILLAALALAGVLWRTAQRPTGPDMRTLLALAILFLFATAVVSGTFTAAVKDDVWNGAAAARYMLPVFLFATILLASRMGDWLEAPRNPALAPAAVFLLLAGGMLHCVAMSVQDMRAGSQPAAITRQPEAQLGEWLASRNLSNGIGDYWSANVVTALSDGRVRVRPAVLSGGPAQGFDWNSSQAWHAILPSPEFVVFRPGNQAGIDAHTIAQAYPDGMRLMQVGPFTVAVLGE